MVGVNPEVAHETMAGLSFHHAVGQALWAGKLFHVDLNAQDVGRYDQDFRFGAEDLKEAFLLVRLLERAGYAGPRHFDAHAYRNEDAEGVWDFARGCMRTYLALAERARHFDSLPEVRDALAAASTPELAEASTTGRRRGRRAQGGGGPARRARPPRLRQRGARPAAGGGTARRALTEGAVARPRLIDRPAWSCVAPRARRIEAFSVAALTAFHRELTDDDRERYARIDEPERLLAWFDEGRVVATTAAFTRRLTVPGATVGCAAVTAVAVVPTHRRRGLLTAMMRRQLEEVRERGEPVAALWASEGAIYGRFGYGISTSQAELTARRPAARIAAPPPPADRCAPVRRASMSIRCARSTSGCGRAARACSIARARGGRTGSTMPSPTAATRRRCGPW